MRTELPAIKILVGTMTGNAERIAEEIELAFADRARIATLDMDRLTPGVFDDDAVFLICSSTYGHGDVPDNARDFYNLLAAHKPDLRSVRYGVIALGDMTYAQTFANGGKRFDAILAELGAKRLGEVFCHDASTGTLPEDEALVWAGAWLGVVAESMAVPHPASLSLIFQSAGEGSRVREMEPSPSCVKPLGTHRPPSSPALLPEGEGSSASSFAASGARGAGRGQGTTLE